uniref:Putative tubulin polyglutamylase TTLL2 n=1 Tax=Sipha flava TaxID=143950 RepID=A0A2S2QNK7_9HEMI
MSSTAPEDRPFIFRVNENGTGPALIKQVCQERGWKEYEGTKNGDSTWSAWSVPADEYWNLWWKSAGFSLSHYKHQKIWQFSNHIPSGSTLCRKDNLWRYLKRMKNIFGSSLFDFSPDSYNLPLEYTKLAAECSHDSDIGEKSIWICKPVGKSQGKGISLISQIGELVYDTNIVVQKYVKNPMLIGGYKYDLRLYVLVPSFHPLTIYMYREGLTRFSTDKYSLNNLDNLFAHLTNSSINKLGPNYSETKEKIGLGNYIVILFHLVSASSYRY